MTYDTNRPTTSGATQREIDRTSETAHDTVDRATNSAHNTVDTVSDKAQQVASDVKDKAQQVADRAQDLGQQAADRADDATTTVGEKMTDVAQTIREKAPTSGPVANAADTAANTLERAGTYLQQQDLADMRADLEGVIRRHPIESLLVGLGVGYLLARSMRR
jgi:methyl-accepting chemotaxis protein